MYRVEGDYHGDTATRRDTSYVESRYHAAHRYRPGSAFYGYLRRQPAQGSPTRPERASSLSRCAHLLRGYLSHHRTPPHPYRCNGGTVRQERESRAATA